MDLDISPFIEELRAKGFFVPSCSQSNFTDTRFSMASILNLKYLDKGSGAPEVAYSGYELDRMIAENLVNKTFSELGYNIITFDSGFRWLNWASSDKFIRSPNSNLNSLLKSRINEFEYLMLNTTLAKLFFDAHSIIGYNQTTPLDDLVDAPREIHRNRVLFTLDQIPQLVNSIQSPKLVYAHIVFPHPPFIVDESGNPLNNNPQDELEAYADQIIYLNSRLSVIINSIINKSESPPVIIIQGDHGATIDYESHSIDRSERLGIFNS
jgi:hypothetical protein